MADPTPEELVEAAVEDQRLELLRQANARLAREVSKLRNSRDELVAAVYRAARDVISGLDLPPVPPPKPDRRSRHEEVAVIMLSDQQLGKETLSYNSEVCEQRMGVLADKIERIVRIHRSDHPVRNLHTWYLGDHTESELIFPGQSWELDSGLFVQLMLNAPRIFGNFHRHMARVFERQHVVGAIGNHGKFGGKSYRDYNKATNGDRMLYVLLKMLLEREKGATRYTWNIPLKEWWAVDRIGEYRTLLFHGHQIRGHSGIPWYGFKTKIQGWKNGAIPEPFDDAACGHFHQPTEMTLNTTTVRINGSTESDNHYAQEQLAAVGRPCQRLMFVHPKHGPTAEYKLWLDED